MRNLTLGVVVWLVMGAAAGAQTSDAELMVARAQVLARDALAPIQKFIDSFNKGDAAAAAATHTSTADLAIIDEVAPHLWTGAQAFKTWSADLDADAKKNGITDQAVTISAPSRTEMTGDRAYVVVPAVYSFKQRGVAMREEAQMTFALKKGDSGWLIHGWTWTGPKPVPAKP